MLQKRFIFGAVVQACLTSGMSDPLKTPPRRKERQAPSRISYEISGGSMERSLRLIAAHYHRSMFLK